MKTTRESLYELLPAIYRIRDAEQGGPLEQYLSVLAEQLAVLEEDVEQLYDDIFIETCAEWVVPYIGDLVGNRTLHGVVPKTLSRRAEVANTVAYRRRKGTASMLEQLARDVTGWNARVVEFFQLVGWSQYMNHPRPAAVYAPDQRRWEPLERLETAFGSASHTTSVRRIAPEKGRFNIPNIGIYLWRLGAHPLTGSPAFEVDARRFTFSPLGNDIPLFNLPQTEDDITHLAEPLNVPEPISRRVLDDRIEEYYGEGSSLSVSDDSGVIDREDVVVCDLSDVGGGDWAHLPQSKVAVDPALGRIAFPAGQPPPDDVRVSYHYGFAADMGGGEYERRAGLDGQLAPVSNVAMGSLVQDAIDDRASGGVVEFNDSGRYPETLAIQVDAGERLELRSANEHRATVVLGGDLEISGGAEAEVALNGLLIVGGTIRVPATTANGLRRLRISHCTLVPGIELGRNGGPQHSDQPSVIVEATDVKIEITSSIVGGLRIAVGSRVAVKESIIDATRMSGVAFAHPDGEAAGGELEIEQSTVIGKIHTTLLRLVSNSILRARLVDGDSWTAPVRSTRKQAGCLRFSYIPEGSMVPRRYRCQPELAVHQAIAAAREDDPLLPTAEEAHIAAGVQLRVQPAFTDLRYGRPAYGQLTVLCPQEIRTGADDESEMGAFHQLYRPQRETNLRIRLEEYLRFGLEAGVFYAS